MAKSDARFGYRADLGREDHDLSQRFGFTCAPGMLLPIFHDIATPGDSYYINHDLTFLRTKPLLSPAMIDVKVHFESFFVPFQMIYQPIEQTMYSMLNPQSNMYAITGSSATWQNNNFPLFKYTTIKQDLLNNRNHSVYHSDCFRMADMLGLNASAWAYDSNNPSRFSYSPNFFPYQLLTYQTIYQYYYRLDDKSNFTNLYCNCDSSYNDSYGFGEEFHFQIHQRPWDFDYFTSMYRSPIVSDASMQGILPKSNYQPLVQQNTVAIASNGSDVITSNEDIKSFASDIGNNYSPAEFSSGVNTSLIRQMFANEKLAMITGRARKTYDSQVLAHFGVKVPHDPKHDITLIGKDTYQLHIGEVTSLSGSSTTPLGDLAGKAWAQGKGHQHKFVAPCHGCVMTIFSIEPLKRYYGGFDRINAVTSAFDIPQPEFDRLGNVPMYRYEAGENAGIGTVTATDIIGWKERYYCNKRKFDKVSLAFMVPRTSIGTNAYAAYMISSAPFGAYTSTNNNTARPDLPSRFYIDRNCMDGLFTLPFINYWQTGDEGEETSENWNKNPYLAYQRDPFIVDSFMKVKKVSWMSKDGEPIYNF